MNTSILNSSAASLLLARQSLGRPAAKDTGVDAGLSPSDRVSLTAMDTNGSCSIDLSKEPRRRPLDASGLQKSLNEFYSFEQREYYSEAKDLEAKKAYYADIDWSQDGKALFSELSKKLTASHTNKLGYSPSEHLYPWVDLRPNGKLQSIYSDQPIDAVKAITEDWEVGKLSRLAENALLLANPLSPEAAATALTFLETAAFNCEHVVPQSWFSKAQPQRGDLHHLFACDPSCNSRRGNLPYDDFKDASGSDWHNDQCGTVGSGKTFEPASGKGAVARATLYFLMRYPKNISRYDKNDLAILVDWSKRFPPDLYEKHRNQAIFEIQGNRNPLIDFPEKIASIDFAQGLR